MVDIFWFYDVFCCSQSTPLENDETISSQTASAAESESSSGFPRTPKDQKALFCWNEYRGDLIHSKHYMHAVGGPWCSSSLSFARWPGKYIAKEIEKWRRKLMDFKRWGSSVGTQLFGGLFRCSDHPALQLEEGGTYSCRCCSNTPFNLHVFNMTRHNASP